MARRERQKRALIVFVGIGAAVGLFALVGGVAFEVGRYLARVDTDKSIIGAASTVVDEDD